MEGINLQFTLVLWSTSGQELKDSMEDDNLINMLINPYHHFSSLMISHNFLGSHERILQQGISIRGGGGKPLGGEPKGDAGPSRRMKAKHGN